MARGEQGHVEGRLAIGLQSITLEGRQLRRLMKCFQRVERVVQNKPNK